MFEEIIHMSFSSADPDFLERKKSELTNTINEFWKELQQNSPASFAISKISFQRYLTGKLSLEQKKMFLLLLKKFNVEDVLAPLIADVQDDCAIIKKILQEDYDGNIGLLMKATLPESLRNR